MPATDCLLVCTPCMGHKRVGLAAWLSHHQQLQHFLLLLWCKMQAEGVVDCTKVLWSSSQMDQKIKLPEPTSFCLVLPPSQSFGQLSFFALFSIDAARSQAAEHFGMSTGAEARCETEHRRCRSADVLPSKEERVLSPTWPPRLHSVVPNMATLILEASALGER